MESIRVFSRFEMPQKKPFNEVVEERLEELGTNAFAVENSAGLKRDAIRSVIRNDGRRSVPRMDTAERICEALGLEFYVGPPRLDDGIEASSPDFVRIPRYDVELSAGSGINNHDNLPSSSLAFRTDWLARKGINPKHCVIVGVSGDSMEPTLYNGDLVMLDRQVTEVRDMRLFGIVESDGTARVKRLQKLEGQLILHSDNRTYPAEVRSAVDAENMIILGQVVWSGHDFER